MVWYSHLFQNFPVCCDPVKGFGIVNKADVFLEHGIYLFIYFFFDIFYQFYNSPHIDLSCRCFMRFAFHFYSFDVNGSMFLISNSPCSLLVYGKVMTFVK